MRPEWRDAEHNAGPALLTTWRRRHAFEVRRHSRSSATGSGARYQPAAVRSRKLSGLRTGAVSNRISAPAILIPNPSSQRLGVGRFVSRRMLEGPQVFGICAPIQHRECVGVQLNAAKFSANIGSGTIWSTDPALLHNEQIPDSLVMIVLNSPTRPSSAIIRSEDELAIRRVHGRQKHLQKNPGRLTALNLTEMSLTSSGWTVVESRNDRRPSECSPNLSITPSYDGLNISDFRG